MNQKHIFYNTRLTTTLLSAELRSVYSLPALTVLFLKRAAEDSFAFNPQKPFFLVYLPNILKAIIK